MVVNLIRVKQAALILGIVLALSLGIHYIFQGQGEEVKPVISRDSQAIHSGSNLDSTRRSAANDFCARYRIERQRARSREVALLNDVLRNAASDREARKIAGQRLVEISGDIEREMKAENLVRCQGGQDCVVILQPGLATAIIISTTMNAAQQKEIKARLGQMLECEESEINLIYQATEL